jgi:adenine deaminase
VADLFQGQLRPVDVAILGDRIVGLGTYQGRTTIDCAGEVLLPGFIDGHIHLESSSLTPLAFAEAAVPHGTTTVMVDPHEIANVAGLRGIRYLLQASAHLPLAFCFTVPSCVPASSLETSAARLSAQDVVALLREPRVVGLAEMMNVPGVLSGAEEVLSKIVATGERVIDGHCPLLAGKDLCAYRAAGISSDHESSMVSEGQEKLSLGFHLMLRCGSAAHNLDLLPSLLNPYSLAHLSLVSDDVTAVDLVHNGHLDALLRQAVSLGVEPLQAVRMVSLNPAHHFGLRQLGALAPGYQADIVTVKDLHSFAVTRVLKAGTLVYEHGGRCVPLPPPVAPPACLLRSVRAPYLQPESFRVRSPRREVAVLGLVPGQILTRRLQLPLPREDGYLRSDPERDIAQVTVIERHTGTGRLGHGFVHGFGLRRGAFGMSFSHDAHNLIIVGMNATDMAEVANQLIALQGGIAVCGEGRSASLPLPIGGLLSPHSAGEVSAGLTAIQSLLNHFGVHVSDPLTALSFLALPVIPELRVTDYGVIDVASQEVIPL